jgi:hypothetical protein
MIHDPWLRTGSTILKASTSAQPYAYRKSRVHDNSGNSCEKLTISTLKLQKTKQHRQQILILCPSGYATTSIWSPVMKGPSSFNVDENCTVPAVPKRRLAPKLSLPSHNRLSDLRLSLFRVHRAHPSPLSPLPLLLRSPIYCTCVLLASASTPITGHAPFAHLRRAPYAAQQVALRLIRTKVLLLRT